MNNPFEYEPSATMLEAQKRLIAHIESLCKADAAFGEEVGKGKMFGILLTSQRELYAFSGQIGGRFDWPGFVPAVFDYLDEDGYFKVHEREISAINHKISELESSSELFTLRQEYDTLKTESEKDVEAYRLKMKAAKLERDLIRGKGLTDDVFLIRESQFMKAEMHRKKLYWNNQLETLSSKINGFIGTINSLKLQRQQKSDALQRWLFEQFVFNGPHGSREKNLVEIFHDYNISHNLLTSLYERSQGRDFLPPSGAGECCEPKLLHFATQNNLQPIEIGMFWWGESPKQEVRHHLQFYPACNGKCRPILEFMGFLPDNELRTVTTELQEIYSDASFIVVNKPSGMLSVPGRSEKPSVFSLLKAKYPDCEELQMVHRLDMDTSGLLVVAKTKEAHKHLQRQFAEHTIRKEYQALLSKPISKENGTITLPLRPDFDDRPRQIVDKINGKEAVTEFFLKENRLKEEIFAVKLVPLTGRTHQLRVHCAHKEGLGNPIKGDRLYGQKSDRLYLHAEYLEFTHPTTGERVKFCQEPEWNMTKHHNK